MTPLANSLRLISIQGLDTLFKIRKILIGLIMVGLGIGFGYLFTLPQETVELTISILVVLLLLVIILNKPLNGLLALLFFMAFIETWIEIPMGAGIPDLSFSRFAIAFLAVFMLAQAAIGRLRFARLSLTDICVILVPLGIVISAPLGADSPIRVIQSAITLHFTPAIMYFFAKNLIKDKDDLHKLFWVMAIFGLAAGAYAIYESTTGHVLFLSKDKEVTRFFRGDTNLRLIVGLLGTGGTGRAMATIIPLTFYLALESKNNLAKILLAGMVVLQFGGLFVTLSRTPMYSLIIALFVMQFFYPQFRRIFIVIAFIVGLFFWAYWDTIQDSEIAQDRFSDEQGDFNGRTPRWEAGINMWKAKPIRGWGFGRYEEESGRFRTDGFNKNFEAIENDYLHIMVGAGLIGLVPYLVFLLAPLINGVRLFFRARAPDWPGFIKAETIVVYWAVILSFLIFSYTAKHTDAVVKMLPFTVAGAVVGTHESLLRHSKEKSRTVAELYPVTSPAESS